VEFNNKTILITGLIICSIIAMYFAYKDIALAIVSGLVGYLSKEIVSSDPQNLSVVPTNESVDDELLSVDTNIDDGETA
jgi:hypothetical protein